MVVSFEYHHILFFFIFGALQFACVHYCLVDIHITALFWNLYAESVLWDKQNQHNQINPLFFSIFLKIRISNYSPFFCGSDFINKELFASIPTFAPTHTYTIVWRYMLIPLLLNFHSDRVSVFNFTSTVNDNKCTKDAVPQQCCW